MAIYRVNHKPSVSKRRGRSEADSSLIQDSPASQDDADIESLEQLRIGESLSLNKPDFNSLELIAKELLTDWRYEC